MYRIVVRLITGDALFPRLETAITEPNEAEQVVDTMKAGFSTVLAFWDQDGDYVAVPGEKILAIFAEKEK